MHNAYIKSLKREVSFNVLSRRSFINSNGKSRDTLIIAVEVSKQISMLLTQDDDDHIYFRFIEAWEFNDYSKIKNVTKEIEDKLRYNVLTDSGEYWFADMLFENAKIAGLYKREDKTSVFGHCIYDVFMTCLSKVREPNDIFSQKVYDTSVFIQDKYSGIAYKIALIGKGKCSGNTNLVYLFSEPYNNYLVIFDNKENKIIKYAVDLDKSTLKQFSSIKELDKELPELYDDEDHLVVKEFDVSANEFRDKKLYFEIENYITTVLEEGYPAYYIDKRIIDKFGIELLKNAVIELSK